MNIFSSQQASVASFLKLDITDKKLFMNKYIVITIIVTFTVLATFFCIFTKTSITQIPISMYNEGSSEDPDSILYYTYCKCNGKQEVDTSSKRAINLSGICYGELYDCKEYSRKIEWE